MRVFSLAIIVFASVCVADPKVYFKEEFGDGSSWESRWVQSEKNELGKFVLSSGEFFNDEEKDKGIKTSQDAKFYGLSAKIPESFSNEGKTLVVQFQVKHEQKIDCGGGYIKLFPADLNLKEMEGSSKYYIMFGPDICGYSSKKVHLIFNYNDKNLERSSEIPLSGKDDEFTHLYTLILKSDNTYEVLLDSSSVSKGSLEEHWQFLEPKEIKDPEASKPEDWDEREMIPDPDSVKPEDWDVPQYITNPEAKQPEDWDEEMDGEWEADKIDNPDYKGDWTASEIKNPAYKGLWVHPMIANPAYKPDDNLYLFKDIGAVGFDLWQVKSGTIFDNILITDCAEYAAEFAKETFEKTKEGEKAMKDKQDAEKKDTEQSEEKEAEEEEDEEDDTEPPITNVDDGEHDKDEL